jgi:acyl-CoA reductase-like NAD-dependent aldehyde dehydrogenase
MPHQNLINGQWVDALDGATDEVLNPATGTSIGRVPSSGAADVDAAVEAASTAFETWGRMTPRARSEVLHRVADAIEADLPTLSRLEMENCGKPASIIEFEMDLTLDNWRFFAGGARFLEGRAGGEYLDEHTSFLRRDPLGVIGSIAPWNYPLNMATWKLGPALAAGNTVVLKPSELTPFTALRLAEITSDILPPGVLNVVTGQGETAGDALVRHPGVAMVSLTGSVETGNSAARRRSSSSTTPTSRRPSPASSRCRTTTPGRTAPHRAACWRVPACTRTSSPASPTRWRASSPATRSTRRPRWVP